ncbi:hypothetical protein [Streptomyces sp. DSM 40750]|uniref:hypothetical protein n=1 Tax=Streptomyces sp. DSM 40750 TaxID=2801030 RepID=UPI00214D013F|nr:hypothetical protein [Streptomyces sp. DSM 40750]UUU19452.1 hypothetical protein JIX55_03545 [Streptomyces sp. DSM 40750]UUU27204.1 hypothetical protein JIX55_47210 [Streptomyces sp. DSM 40750]
MIPLRRSRLFRTAVPAHPSWAAGVRRTVAAHLTRWELSTILDDAVLATDERFADAVRHTSADPADTIAVVAAPADDRGTDPPEPGDVGKKVRFSLAVRGPV